VEYGLTSFLQRRQLTEALVPPGTNIDEVQMLLRSYLIGSSVTTDLVIVDPYFFVSSDAGYPQFVEQILHPVLGRLNNLTVVTLPNKVNVLALSSITNLLNTSSPNLNIIHKTSIAFHDRFWINPISSKGFLTGTSLNGLGRRYALVDYLQSSDVAEVLAVLQREGVL
jgi:hypothetical protein